MDDGALSLSNELLKLIFSYLGEGYWIFLCPVSRHWEKSYHSLYPSKKSLYSLSVESINRLEYSISVGLRHSNRSVGTGPPHFSFGLHASKEVLNVAIERGLTLRQYTSNGAAQSGRLSLLKWLIFEKGCPWSLFSVAKHSIFGGSLQILKWVIEENNWSHKMFNFSMYASSRGQIEILEWLKQKGMLKEAYPSSLTAHAAMNGHFKAFVWLFDNGFEVGEKSSKYAVQSGSIEIIDWMNTRGYEINTHELRAESGKGGSVHLLEYLNKKADRKIDRRMKNEILFDALLHGNLEMCQCMLDSGAEWPNKLWDFVQKPKFPRMPALMW
eukprot:CAMPEP_0171451662 /NCGR_PEP_ID=MMETSP0945-20130129/78_1 /TAXON_ID=109269 /ORGANISM="Vaucheria litorea, Strain CCMP2940" /LENGTH=326 /DNA_ID=CAMNT_0011976169 /DNA_START=66 /DNA_END=1043 /DNA_ORIENTATION=-